MFGMLKRPDNLCALGAIAIIASGACAQTAWVSVWADEFNGSVLNSSNWEVMLGTGTNYGLTAWGNNELQYYTGRTQNLTVGSGMLTITARAESYFGSSYTSARIRSLNKRDFTYGRVEARMKVPAGQGLWPALWMLPSTTTYGGWAAGGEIDILETVNAADQAHGTIHHGGQWPSNQQIGGSLAGNWSADFNVYAMEWEPDEIRWYVNGSQYFAVTSNQWFSANATSNDRAPFDRPFHFLINLAVGGNWPGNPNASTPFPAQFQIDYLRMLQRPAQGPATGTAPRATARIEAENFDVGGATFAYFDTEASNVGGVLRTQEAVDIEVCSEGGHNVGWFRPGEWMEYTVNVPRTGRYEFRLRFATPNSSCTYRVAANGVDVSPITLLFPSGAWQTYRTQKVNVDLTSGVNVIRLTNTSSVAGREYNINWIELVVPGDADGDGSVSIEDLYAFENSRASFPDVDGDGTAYTAFDRATLIRLIRATDRTP